MTRIDFSVPFAAKKISEARLAPPLPVYGGGSKDTEKGVRDSLVTSGRPLKKNSNRLWKKIANKSFLQISVGIGAGRPRPHELGDGAPSAPSAGMT